MPSTLTRSPPMLGASRSDALRLSAGDDQLTNRVMGSDAVRAVGHASLGVTVSPAPHSIRPEAVCLYVDKTLDAGAKCGLRVGFHHDGAMYAGEDTLVSVAFLPGTSQALVLPCSIIPRVVPVEDVDVTDEVAKLRSERTWH